MVHYSATGKWIGKAGKTQTDVVRITHTWLKDNGAWKIITGMSAPVGLDARRAGLLRAAGFKSMSELARVTAERLLSVMKDEVSLEEAGRWVLAARQYLGIKASGS